MLKEEANGFEVVNADGSWYKKYRVNGKLHNSKGPAYTEVYSDGLWEEKYYRNGEIHNTKGPDYIRVESDG